MTAFGAGNLATTLLILRATELFTPIGGLEAATRTALLLYAGHKVAATLVSIPAGKAADRWGYRPVLGVGLLTGLAAYLIFGVTGAVLSTVTVAFVLAGVTIGVVETRDGRGSSRGALHGRGCTRGDFVHVESEHGSRGSGHGLGWSRGDGARLNRRSG